MRGTIFVAVLGLLLFTVLPRPAVAGAEDRARSFPFDVAPRACEWDSLELPPWPHWKRHCHVLDDSSPMGIARPPKRSRDARIRASVRELATSDRRPKGVGGFRRRTANLLRDLGVVPRD